jgi:transposase
VPTLQPSDVVIMDNLGSHKIGGVREAVEARGASLVYRPPYSPDLDPIEQAFAELKGTPRRIAARTMSRLWDALGDLLARFTLQECANYLASAGYVSSGSMVRQPPNRSRNGRLRLWDRR